MEKQTLLIFLTFLDLATSSSNSISAESEEVNVSTSHFSNVSIDDIMKELVENKSWTTINVHRKK